MDKNMNVGSRLKGAADYLWREGTVYIISRCADRDVLLY